MTVEELKELLESYPDQAEAKLVIKTSDGRPVAMPIMAFIMVRPDLETGELLLSPWVPEGVGDNVFADIKLKEKPCSTSAAKS